MKKIFALLLCVCVFPLCACHGAINDKLSIVCTGFAQYDFVRNIIAGHGDSFDLKYLLSSGVDIHNYQPSAADIAAIKLCDLFIYTGGQSDDWAQKVTSKPKNKDMKHVALLDIVEAKQEEDIENGNDHEVESDEHVWLSLRCAQEIVNTILEIICELDTTNAADYRLNATNYTAALSRLDDEFKSTVKASKRDTVLFADRFPFRYLVDDYSIKYFAAFNGCSMESEASASTIKYLINKVNELNLSVILITETAQGGSLAQTIINNSRDKNQRVLLMDSCQSVNKRDINNGKTYLSIMRDNLVTLEEALR